MAIMKFSEELCKTEGEKIVFRFLKQSLSDDFIVWNNVSIFVSGGGSNESAEIDVLIYHKQIGFLVMEVKDWRIDDIKNFYAKGNVKLANGKVHTNPYVQARLHAYTLMRKLQRKSDLLDLMTRRVQAPVNPAAIFPFIESVDWKKKLADLSIADAEDIQVPFIACLFKEDFSGKSVLGTGDGALNRLKNLRFTKFPSTYSDVQIGLFDDVLGVPYTEESLVGEIEGEGSIKIANEYNIVDLDEQQKSVANGYLAQMYNSPGPLLIRGVAGSGKTIILLHMFSQIATDPNMRILYVARQKELVADFERNLQVQGIFIGHPNHFTGTFHKLFRDVFGEVEYNALPRKEGSLFPSDDGISGYIASNLDKVEGRYDFVFIDEGHNFPDQWVRLIVSCAKNRGKGNVVYVEDFQQNIYRIKRDFKNAGLGAINKESQLLVNYRNTKEISHFALNLTDKHPMAITSLNLLSNLRPGRLPSILLSKSIDENADRVYEKFSQWEKEGFFPSEIAIIYPSANLDETGLFMNIINRFSRQGYKLSIHYTKNKIESMFGKDYRGIIVPRGGVDEKTVNLITSFSSQGLSYKCVILIMDDRTRDWDENTQKNLLYISLTRAMDDLSLAFSKETIYYKKALQVIEGMRSDGN